VLTYATRGKDLIVQAGGAAQDESGCLVSLANGRLFRALIGGTHMKGKWPVLFAALGLTLAAGGAQAQTKLKWAHVYETSEPFHTQSVWAAQEIAKRTNGRYQVDVYPASQLGKETDINQGLSLGSVDVIISGSSFAARSFPPIGVTYYPYTFRDANHLLAYTKSDVFKELAKGYSDKTGHQILAVTYYGARHTSSNKPIKTCADMKGLKIRVPDVPAYLAMPRACGANTAPIAFAEVYLALQNGTVDAQENPLTTIEAKKFYEVQKHIALTGHIVDHLNTVASSGLWKRLSDEDKKIFSDVAQEAAARATAEIQAKEKELVGFFKEKGLTVTEVNKDDFKDAVLKNVSFESFGYRKADYDRIQAIHSEPTQ
jgi:tripartite ATP-independent transporter DctP family solute receptor